MLLIIPGFATDVVGLFMIFPPTRKNLIRKIKNKQSTNKNDEEDMIEGHAEDIDEKNDK